MEFVNHLNSTRSEYVMNKSTDLIFTTEGRGLHIKAEVLKYVFKKRNKVTQCLMS